MIAANELDTQNYVWTLDSKNIKSTTNKSGSLQLELDTCSIVIINEQVPIANVDSRWLQMFSIEVELLCNAELDKIVSATTVNQDL